MIDIAKDLKLKKLPPKKRKKALREVSGFFDKLVLFTFLSKLSEEQWNQFRTALEANELNKISQIAAGVQDLSRFIGDRLDLEYTIMKSAIV